MAAEDFPAVDFGMWLRMAAEGWEFSYLDEKLGAYRIHGATHWAAFGPPQGPGYVQGVEIVAAEGRSSSASWSSTTAGSRTQATCGAWPSRRGATSSWSWRAT